MPYTVLIADDHPLILEGIVSQINTDSTFQIIATTDNGTNALKLYHEMCPDMAVFDIDMAGLNGIELTEQIKKTDNRVKILLLTMHTEPWVLFKAKMANPDGILLKNSPAFEILSALKSIMRGEKVFSSEVQNCIMEGSMLNQSILSLTTRETEILKHIAAGSSTKIIADTLCISVNTVETYRKNLFQKFNVGNMAELVRKAIEMGIVK